MSQKMDDVTIPGEPKPTQEGAIRTLTIVASALTTASILVNVVLQIAHYMKKRPAGPNQRDRIDTAQLALSLLKQAPGVIKQVRLLAWQLRMQQDRPDLP